MTKEKEPIEVKITNKDDDDLQDESIRIGAVAVWSKKVSVTELKKIMLEILGNKDVKNYILEMKKHEKLAAYTG